nr:FAD-binding oxidoreductase [Anaerolineae bacterium]
MPDRTADIVICGAGIAGISAAYFLSREVNGTILLADERPPLTLTSDKSTEAYRNWWPGPDGSMIALMDRSIDLLEELARASDNRFLMNRRGYVYTTGRKEQAECYLKSSKIAEQQGAGELRIHSGACNEPAYLPSSPEGFEEQPDGADFITDQALIRKHFPCLSEQVVAVLHTRRCGWFSGQQLGMLLLERARQNGVRVVNARVDGIDIRHNAIRGVRLAFPDGHEECISTGIFVNAAGPYIQPVASLLDIHLPVFSERHLKVVFKDHLGLLPRDAPLLIWDDPQCLGWTSEERAMLEETEELRWMLGIFPPGVHTRPEGGKGSQVILGLWPYDAEPTDEVYPIHFDPLYPEIVMRGLAAIVPALAAYVSNLPKPSVDGGYYTKTRENRLLACPLPVEGAYLIGALSGFGLMAACGAADLLTAHILKTRLPPYAAFFRMERYDDPAYRAKLECWDDTGQL